MLPAGTFTRSGRPGRVKIQTILPALVFALFCGGNISAQEGASCAEKLKNARLLFDKGQVEPIPSLLTSCLKSGFNREEEIAAYKLLIQAYLLTDKVLQADSAMNAFLKRNPEYRVSTADHPGFTYLFRSFDVKPMLQAGIHAGTNIPFLTFVHDNLTAGEPCRSGYSSNAANLMISADLRLRTGKRTEAGIEAGYSRLRFANKVDYLGFGIIRYTEVQHRLEVPLFFTWEIKPAGTLIPYLRAGAGVAFNIKTTADVSFEMTDKNNPYSRTGETIDRKGSRTPADIFIQPGAGIKYKVPHAYVFAELRADLGIINQNRSGGSTGDLLRYYYLWSDPSFRINALSLNAGYIYIFYKPSKRNN